MLSRILVLVLSALLAAPTVRAAPREEPQWIHEVHGFIAGGRLLRLEISSTYSSRGLETIGAALYGTPTRTTAANPTSFASRTRDAREIAPDIPIPQPDSAQSPTEETWVMELQWDATFTEQTVTSTYRVGPDRITVRFPRELIGADPVEKASIPAAPIEFEVNGVASFVDASVLTSWQPAARRLGPELVVTDPPMPLHEPRAFTEKWAEFRNLMEVVNKQRLARIDETGKARCAGPCLSCAAGLLATLGTSIALVGMCGGTLVTGGATAVGCVISFIAHESSMLMAAAGCGMCNRCAASGGRTGGVRPEGCCPCLGTPNCQCPSSCTPAEG